MNIQDIKRILVSFADNASDIIVDKGNILATIRGEDISITIQEKDGELLIKEDEILYKPIIWIGNRLAQLPQLAQRINDYTNSSKDFVNPNGELLRDMDTDPSETLVKIDNITQCLRENLQNRIPGTTSITYLTSDAGEGKTTIINQLAVEQASLFLKKETNWLLVPIPLGGRPFLRFDDIVIASLVNRLRFRNFYYESFIELVKIGLIMPAFDGFEEMFMDRAPGEALSATGQLMSKLGSSGNLLIAARHAFFDYKSFSTQARLFDTIGSNSVAFSKVSINRWNKSQFIEYARKRRITNASDIYDLVHNKLQSDTHPILTRPVLVHQLLNVFSEKSDLTEVLSSLDTTSGYFPNFVNVIVQREAETKWIDSSGEPFKPLLKLEQHYELLSLVAEEMWLNNTDSLQDNILDVISEMYGETNKMPVSIVRQVKERLKQHALITKSEVGPNHYRFDHEEFKDFFLGINLFNCIKDGRNIEFKNLIRKGLLLNQTIETISAFWKEKLPDVTNAIDMFNVIQKDEPPTSFIKENSGNLILKLLDGSDHDYITLEHYNFNSNKLQGIAIKKVSFIGCHFQSTSLIASSLEDCKFDRCSFDLIELDSDHNLISDCYMTDCVVSSIRNRVSDANYYDPISIIKELEKIGFIIHSKEELAATDEDNEEFESDEDLVLVEKALRKFTRATQINDTLFRIRLANNADYFVKNVLPILLENDILNEVDYQGGGQKRRFKLGVPLEKVNYALTHSNGKFSTFLEKIQEK